MSLPRCCLGGTCHGDNNSHKSHHPYNILRTGRRSFRGWSQEAPIYQNSSCHCLEFFDDVQMH